MKLRRTKKDECTYFGIGLFLMMCSTLPWKLRSKNEKRNLTAFFFRFISSAAVVENVNI